MKDNKIIKCPNYQVNKPCWVTVQEEKLFNGANCAVEVCLTASLRFFIPSSEVCSSKLEACEVGIVRMCWSVFAGGASVPLQLHCLDSVCKVVSEHWLVSHCFCVHEHEPLGQNLAKNIGIDKSSRAMDINSRV